MFYMSSKIMVTCRRLKKLERCRCLTKDNLGPDESAAINISRNKRLEISSFFKEISADTRIQSYFSPIWSYKTFLLLILLCPCTWEIFSFFKNRTAGICLFQLFIFRGIQLRNLFHLFPMAQYFYTSANYIIQHRSMHRYVFKNSRIAVPE